jgi:hypothetical protein
VVSKLAPVPAEIESAVAALRRQKYGVTYDVTYTDGRKDSMSEGQIVARVLDYLRSQVQLVVRYAATPGNLRNFLTAQGIEP